MKVCFLFEELVTAFYMLWVRDAAVYGTDRSTAWGVIVFGTFGALFCDNVVEFLGACFVLSFVTKRGAFGEPPRDAPFVDSIVGALRLAGPAVNALVRYLNSHS